MIPFYYHVQRSSIHHQFDHRNICYSTKKLLIQIVSHSHVFFKYKKKKLQYHKQHLKNAFHMLLQRRFFLLAYNVFIFWIKVRTKSKAVYMKANCIWRICINFICILLTLNLKGYLCIRLLSSRYAKKKIIQKIS